MYNWYEVHIIPFAILQYAAIIPIIPSTCHIFQTTRLSCLLLRGNPTSFHQNDPLNVRIMHAQIRAGQPHRGSRLSRLDDRTSRFAYRVT